MSTSPSTDKFYWPLFPGEHYSQHQFQILTEILRPEVNYQGFLEGVCNLAPDGRLGGWFGNACRTFTLEGGQVRYIAFDGDPQGGWAAAPGLSIPVDGDGRYAATWGVFNFGSKINFGRSAFVVSTIATEKMGLQVQGMRICDVHSDTCSSVPARGAAVHNAYTSATAGNGKSGGTIVPGPVRLAVSIGYCGYPLPESRS
jgi:hypothetical protein